MIGRPHPPEVRQQAVSLVLSGMPVKDAAAKVNVDQSLVYAWTRSVRKVRRNRKVLVRQPDKVASEPKAGLRSAVRDEIRAAIREIVREELRGLR